MDAYAVPYSAFFIAISELIAFAWIYGIDKHFENIRTMMGYVMWPEIFWKVMIKYVVGTLILVILALIFSDLKPLVYDGYEFPPYTEVVGWAMVALSVLMIPLFALWELACVARGRKTMKDIIHPDIVFDNQGGHGTSNEDLVENGKGSIAVLAAAASGNSGHAHHNPAFEEE